MVPCQELADPEARKRFGEKAGPAAGRRTPQISRRSNLPVARRSAPRSSQEERVLRIRQRRPARHSPRLSEGKEDEGAPGASNDQVHLHENPKILFLSVGIPVATRAN